MPSLQVDRERGCISMESSMSPGARAKATNMCYLIFTSGSTGRPKGTVLQHDGAVNLIHGIHRRACLPTAAVLLRMGIFSSCGNSDTFLRSPTSVLQAHWLGGGHNSAENIPEL